MEGQNKTLKGTKTLGEATIDIKSISQEEKIKSSLKIYGEFGIDFLITSRESSFLKNFVGYADFRVLSTTFFKESVTNPTIVLRQLGANVHWNLEPFSKVSRNNEYIWDFSYEKIRGQVNSQEISQDNVLEDFKQLIEQKVSKTIFTLDTTTHPEIRKTLDLLYQVEEDENDLEKESLELAYQKNGAYFYSCVPNETIVLEVYQNATLLGYAFFPLANINMDQNHYEKIIPLGSEDQTQKFGEVIVKVEFHPITVQVDQGLFTNLESLDFDDISERFYQPSKLYEAYFLMDKNIEKSKNLIWPKKITNIFKTFTTPKKFILNLSDIQNLSAVFSKDLSFNDLEVRGKSIK